MKKTILILLVLALAVSCTACGGESAAPARERAPSAAAETAELSPIPEITPEPEYLTGEIIADGFGVLYTTLRRGDTVSVKGERDEYYVIDMGGFDGYIEKRLVRLGNEPFEPFTGYAAPHAVLYEDPYFQTVLRELGINQKLNVIDGGDGWLLAETDGVTGYIPDGLVSESTFKVGSGGGKSSGGSGHIDGGDIALAFQYRERGQIVRLAASGKGTVLADGAEVYILLPGAGDTVSVKERGSELCTVVVGGQEGSVPSWLVFMDGDGELSYWDGYARHDAVWYRDYRMITEPIKLKVNDEVRVLLELGDRLFVDVSGEKGYMRADFVSETPIPIRSGGSGGSSGPEWTEPKI